MAGHGRYTIVSKLADGGMAEIFLGIQHGAEGFQKPVVLKRILTAFSADPQFRNMFLDEAHISMSLNHSYVVQVLDLGVSRGRYFLVLELVDGWDLDKIMHRAKAASMVWPPATGSRVAPASRLPARVRPAVRAVVDQEQERHHARHVVQPVEPT